MADIGSAPETSINQVQLSGRIATRKLPVYLPTERVDLCEASLETNGNAYPIFASGEASVKLSSAPLDRPVVISGKVVMHRWKTAMGPKDRMVVSVDDIQPQ